MQIHSLPAGGAFGAAETEVSPVTAVNKAALPALMNTTLPDKIKSKPFWRQSGSFKDTFI